ncbi:TfoX/Sxy family protein [Varunaivibrio sulfuroxidans]|uniref:DNA transformation protein n=1 Tax=Varunaivibrio sulfuroxidans TaxID=1773489 RepID=A0A4R3J578_9PROT|nr:TfoX/Sxy family protein [Varunaivibrio sulfuroxidans]TCS60968.1 DNA transformation protein [Varunaivibrio sulfuroxidans]WES31625.1 TfoX/Sxy family protein [Varunaivibrio sulfuroxidans]
MSYSREFRDHVLDLLDSAGSVTPRAMFGGVGLYLDGVFFAIISDDVLYFKVDDDSRKAYISEGMAAFAPFIDRPALRSYYEVPSDLFDDGETLRLWARRAWEAARRSAKPASSSGPQRRRP